MRTLHIILSVVLSASVASFAKEAASSLILVLSFRENT